MLKSIENYLKLVFVDLLVFLIVKLFNFNYDIEEDF